MDEKWIILYHGVQEWSHFYGTVSEAIAHATMDNGHHNYGRTGVTVVRFTTMFQSDPGVGGELVTWPPSKEQ